MDEKRVFEKSVVRSGFSMPPKEITRLIGSQYLCGYATMSLTLDVIAKSCDACRIPGLKPNAFSQPGEDSKTEPRGFKVLKRSNMHMTKFHKLNGLERLLSKMKSHDVGAKQQHPPATKLTTLGHLKNVDFGQQQHLFVSCSSWTLAGL